MKSLYITICCLMAFAAYGQQDPDMGLYPFNMAQINAGSVGIKGGTSITASYRQQWLISKIEGAPRSVGLAWEQDIPKKHLGLGATIQSDVLGLQKNLSGLFTISYRMKIHDSCSLSFGLGTGMRSLVLDGTKMLTEEPDNIIPPRILKALKVQSQAGIFLQHRKFNVGLSVADLFANVDAFGDANNFPMTLTLHYFLTAAVYHTFENNVLFVPTILLKDDLKGPASLDLRAFVFFGERVGFGIGHRRSFNTFPKPHLAANLKRPSAVMGSLHLRFGSIQMNYGYEGDLSGLGNFSNGSHDLSLIFSKRMKTGGKSFWELY